jgi:prepilin-type N-terminal cleavage/methylation domain-containing protein
MEERGFTVVEVIVAVVIFSAATLCGMSFFIFGNHILMRAREESFALMIAENEMAQVRTKCVAHCSVFADRFGLPEEKNHPVPQLGITYHSLFSWDQVDTPYAAPAGGQQHPVYDWYRVVWVTVTWHSNSDNADRSLSLHTAGVMSPRHDY